MRQFIVLIVFFVCVSVVFANEDEQKSILLQQLQQALYSNDYHLIETHADNLSVEHFNDILAFMTDSQTIADNHHFDVSNYAGWDVYNFQRPIDNQVITMLARRDLFLDPARQLNNHNLTNMSSEALAALTFSQTYVEETWDQEPPWDGDANPYFNWVHPDLLESRTLGLYLSDDFLYRERVGYWYATYWSAFFALAYEFGIGQGTDQQRVLYEDPNPPRLAGYAYPIGNQLYVGTAETVYWFSDYLRIGDTRYGDVTHHNWDTNITFSYSTEEILQIFSDDVSLISAMFDTPFARKLRLELTHPETASFWNTMRYVHAAARHREGGASPEYPNNGQPSVLAIRYDERSEQPMGRDTQDVSAFAIITTVYSDSILLDFTNWDGNNQQLLVNPIDENRSDGLHRLVSERNKAIRVIEHLNNELVYPNATHITGSRGLRLALVTQYDNPEDGDFLPYTPEEAYFLVMALHTEATQFRLSASHDVLCNAPLLQQGYNQYALMNTAILTWQNISEDVCI